MVLASLLKSKCQGHCQRIATVLGQLVRQSICCILPCSMTGVLSCKQASQGTLLEHEMRTAKCGLMHALDTGMTLLSLCDSQQLGLIHPSLWQEAGTWLMARSVTKVGHIAGGRVESSGQIMSPASSCKFIFPGLPRETRGNNYFLHSSFLCRCIFYWFLFSFLLNSLNSCHTHTFHCCCLRACYCHFTAVHDLPPAVSYDTHTKN